MGKTLDLGLRVELQPMDKHCHDISLGLYQRDIDGVPHFLVHTYSAAPGSAARVTFIKQAMTVMLGLKESADSPGWLRFPCGTVHLRALNRGFLDLCKLANDDALEPKPLTGFDKKANSNLTAQGLDEGVYEIKPEPGADKGPKRAEALARGFLKVCEMTAVGDSTTKVAFPCKTNHDALMGMLFFRAQNVRASMQEEEMAASRGVLSAPSQQE